MSERTVAYVYVDNPVAFCAHACESGYARIVKTSEPGWNVAGRPVHMLRVFGSPYVLIVGRAPVAGDDAQGTPLSRAEGLERSKQEWANQADAAMGAREL